MSTIKISALPAATAVTSDDLVPIVDAPGTSPVTQKATAQQVKDFVLGSTNGDANISGAIAVNTNKFTVASSTGNTAIAGDLSVNTNKFTVASSTGNTAIAGDVNVNAGKFTVASATGNVGIGGSATVASGLTVTTGGASVTGNSSITGTIGASSDIGSSASALATSATSGFLWAPSCPGTPSGTPSGFSTGGAPIIVDTSASKLWARIGGSWSSVAFGSGTTSMPITGAAQADPSAPAADNVTLYAAESQASTPARIRVRDTLNQPYWLAEHVQARRMRSSVFPDVTDQSAATMYLVVAGNAPASRDFAIGNGITNYQLLTTSTSFPYRSAVMYLNSGALKNLGGTVGTPNTGTFFGNTAGRGGFFFRCLFGTNSSPVAANGCAIGMFANVSTDPTSSGTKMQGVYFYRDTTTSSGNWTIAYDNNTTRTNTNTTMAYTALHLYELTLYCAPNSQLVYWQINDLTAATTASGSVTVNTTVNTLLGAMASVSSIFTDAPYFCGMEVWYDVRV
mgnify:CR=1 FL=1